MIAAVIIILEIGLQKIGKEENFQNHEHYKKFDEDDQPNLFPPFRHIGKTVTVKPKYSLK